MTPIITPGQQSDGASQVLPASPSKQSSRVRRYRLIPLTEPYIRATYTAHAINLPRTRGQ
ncbi:hypothetical protein C7I36_16050 [Zobellella taiwanensis]|uniref:Uncharacterized protein n=1 Tax=Zobellella taiwanensis TaxID=347535 RepID=A0A2P7QG84_9GAMM|nr:hypothetical protein C7I36_16050 [Zobellella taiwanensis]